MSYLCYKCPSLICQNCTGFNLQALRFLQISLEERTKVKLFQDASKVEKDTKKRGKGGKAKDFTLVTT
jgi:hypothetical protein